MFQDHSLVFWVFWIGVISALATGLGAIPVHFLKKESRNVQALATAFAAGMMISASVFSLMQEGIELKSQYHFAPYMVIGGLLLGAAFFWAMEKYVHNDKVYLEKFRDKVGIQGVMIFVVMFIHSIPEGIAIGVGFATENFAFGIMMAVAITVHNIPEGIAISLPLHNKGVSTKVCALMSILTSIPQPLLAVPALLAVNFFEPLLPVGLGFAGGAMLYLVISEMLPDSIEKGGHIRTAWGTLLGLACMLAFSVVMDDVFTH